MLRYSILVAAAVAGLATSAVAQDRTPPSGLLDGLRAQSYAQDSGDPAYAGEPRYDRAPVGSIRPRRY